MRKSGRAFTPKVGVFDPQRWVREWRRLHPVKPIECVAGTLGAPIRTVEKWFAGASAPSLYWVGEIFRVYGPEFLVAGLATPIAWLDRAARLEKRARLADALAAFDADAAPADRP